MKNQCDGCRRKLPLRNGLHVDGMGLAIMGCTAHLYEEPEPEVNGKPRNRVKCKACGDVIESRWVHEFVTCSCGSVSVDGGLDYYKRLWPSGEKADWIEEVP